jgi:hypothetical protein
MLLEARLVFSHIAEMQGCRWPEPLLRLSKVGEAWRANEPEKPIQAQTARNFCKSRVCPAPCRATRCTVWASADKRRAAPQRWKEAPFNGVEPQGVQDPTKERAIRVSRNRAPGPGEQAEVPPPEALFAADREGVAANTAADRLCSAQGSQAQRPPFKKARSVPVDYYARVLAPPLTQVDPRQAWFGHRRRTCQSAYDSSLKGAVRPGERLQRRLRCAGWAIFGAGARFPATIPR